MGVFARGNTLWIRYRDVDGKWRNASTGYPVGDEGRAHETLAEVERRVADARSAEGLSEKATRSALTLQAFAEKWLEQGKTETVDDDRGRLYNHVIPALGHIRIAELRPRHIREFVEALKQKKKLGNLRKDGTRVETDELIAPRTVRHVYDTLRAMLNDAVADEVIPSNPCVLKDELPRRRTRIARGAGLPCSRAMRWRRSSRRRRTRSPTIGA
jgi:hypothetical protein